MLPGLAPELRGHYYSVSHALMHEQVDGRLTATMVEIFHRGPRVAVHVRKSGPRAPHHRPGPHAPGPSAPPRVDARAADRVGPHHRPADRRPRPGDPRGSAAATARRLPGPADAENLFWGVGRGGVPRARLRGRFSRTSTSPGAAITTTTTRRPPLCSGEVRAMATGVASCQSPWVLDVTCELGVGRRGNGRRCTCNHPASWHRRGR